MFTDVIVPLIAFVFVLALCYITTKFVGNKFAGGKKNRILKVVETLSLGLDRTIYLISAGKKYYLFYWSKKGMELISEIETDEQLQNVTSEAAESAGIFEFKNIFDTYSGLSEKKAVNHGTDQNGKSVSKETAGILKNIKRLQKINNNIDRP